MLPWPLLKTCLAHHLISGTKHEESSPSQILCQCPTDGKCPSHLRGTVEWFNVTLPSQTGAGAVHCPMSAQRMTSLPFSSKPSAQAKVQLLLYADAPADGEQSMLPWAGLSGASHAMAEGRMPDTGLSLWSLFREAAAFLPKLPTYSKPLTLCLPGKLAFPCPSLGGSLFRSQFWHYFPSEPNLGGGISCVVPQTLHCIIYAGL